MKATLWLWSLVTTMLCASQGVYSSPLSDYQYSDARALQDYKRTKPSLSIVNPLDVLRQRLLLEIARRQMKENSKQVQLNRAILKNVGKRDNELDYFDYDNENSITNNNNNNNHQRNTNNLNQLNNQLNNQFNKRNNNNLNNKNSNRNFNLNNEQEQQQQPINNDDDYQIKYVYSLHKNSFSHK